MDFTAVTVEGDLETDNASCCDRKQFAQSLLKNRFLISTLTAVLLGKQTLFTIFKPTDSRKLPASFLTSHTLPLTVQFKVDYWIIRLSSA